MELKGHGSFPAVADAERVDPKRGPWHKESCR